MVGDVLDAVANPLNRRLLAALAVEPGHARRLSSLVHASESEVSRRLKSLERLGILKATWQRKPHNVRVYHLAVSSWQLTIGPTGLDLQSDRATPLVRPVVAVPSQIPAATHFVGRTRELKLLSSTAPVIIVEGMAGIGKTALLAKAVSGTNAFWFTCRGTETVAWLAGQYASHLASHGQAEAAARLHSATATTESASLLLDQFQRDGAVTVLDDVHLIQDKSLRALLGDAIASMQTGRLFVASRERLAHPRRPGVAVVTLKGLEPEDAANLLRAAGIQVPADLISHLADEVGGHPLALHLLSQVAKEKGLEPLLDGRPESELTHYLLDEITPTLTEAERTALGHASIYPLVFDAGDLAALGTRNAESILATLHRRHLVNCDESGYRLSEVVRNFFYENLQDKARLHALAERRELAKVQERKGEVPGETVVLKEKAPRTKKKAAVVDFEDRLTDA